MRVLVLIVWVPESDSVVFLAFVRESACGYGCSV